MLWTTVLFGAAALGFFATNSYIDSRNRTHQHLEKTNTAANFVTRLKAGKKVRAILNICPEDEEGWDGKNDPLGTIKCGETYEVRYVPSTGKWIAKGLHEISNQIVEIESTGPDPEKNMISIWGLVLAFDSKGHLYDRGKVGKDAGWGYLDS